MKRKKPQQLRIISGKWRGRKVHFPNIESLRPTADSIRETVFNWLIPYIENATCLDLFAGSGALGFEALSRGAKHVTFVDAHRDVTQAITQTADTLGTTDIDIYTAHAPKDYLPLKHKYDIVFLDPPFKENIIPETIAWLEDNHLLANDALVYIEMGKKTPTLIVADYWACLKDKTQGQVRYLLYKHARHSAPETSDHS